MADKKVLTPQDLRKLLAYDPETGVLTWKIRPDMKGSWNTRYAGTEALTALCNGYRHGKILGQQCLAHRAIWAMVSGAWPKGQIDHINGDILDNRIANLRDVSQAENLRNQKRSVRNTTGATGVYRSGRDGAWVAQIYTRGRARHIGTFDSFASAVSARLEAEKTAGFHENHGKR